MGNHLSGLKARVHAYIVCDDEDYFYKYIDSIFAEMGATPEVVGSDSKSMLRCIQAKVGVLGGHRKLGYVLL